MSKRKVGRPRVKIDEGQLEKLAAIECSFEEMASIVGCSVRTLHDNFRTVIEKGRAQARASLKRRQFELAMDGNATMLICWGRFVLARRRNRQSNIREPSKSTPMNFDSVSLRESLASLRAWVRETATTRFRPGIRWH